MSLTDKLNKGFRLPFQDYTGAIPKTVPALKLDSRTFAGGDLVLHERLAALTPNEQGATDQEKIDGWGTFFDLADLCATFEDLVKLQKDSGFLRGIRGIVKKDEQAYVAVDIDYVKAAIIKGKEKYFKNQISNSEIVHYQTREGVEKQAQVQNVIRFPYNESSVAFTADQFNAIDAKRMNRKNIIHDRDMEPAEIIKGNKVIHLAWGIYSAKTIVPLVEKQRKFTFEGKQYDFKELMGFYLPSVPSGNCAEGRALCVDRLGDGSRLCGNCGLGVVNDRVVGVDNKYAEGVAKK